MHPCADRFRWVFGRTHSGLVDIPCRQRDRRRVARYRGGADLAALGYQQSADDPRQEQAIRVYALPLGGASNRSATAPVVAG